MANQIKVIGNRHAVSRRNDAPVLKPAAPRALRAQCLPPERQIVLVAARPPSNSGVDAQKAVVGKRPVLSVS